MADRGGTVIAGGGGGGSGGIGGGGTGDRRYSSAEDAGTTVGSEPARPVVPRPDMLSTLRGRPGTPGSDGKVT